MKSSISINVASFGGRSHMLDLARELKVLGYNVRFYSYVPYFKAKKYGLEKSCSYSYFFVIWPILLLLKLTNRNKIVLAFFCVIVDYFLAFWMKPCDIFIAQSPIFVYSLKYFKRKYKSIIVLDRGTSHVTTQFDVLTSNPNYKIDFITKRIHIPRDLAGYKLADYISVGANHVKESFVINGISTHKIFVNNYGVNLSSFYPTELDDNELYDIIFVGAWSFRKGCDLLTKSIIDLNLKILHVGSILDLEFPIDARFIHVDSVPEHLLINYYKKAKVFVLPSREEGLALVQIQALACGLPIVCSPKSGGIDLTKYIQSAEHIIEVTNLSVNSLNEAIIKALRLYKNSNFIRDAYVSIDNLSWKAYGIRYDKFITNLIIKK